MSPLFKWFNSIVFLMFNFHIPCVPPNIEAFSDEELKSKCEYTRSGGITRHGAFYL